MANILQPVTDILGGLTGGATPVVDSLTGTGSGALAPVTDILAGATGAAAPVVDTVSNVLDGLDHALGTNLTQTVTPITSQVEHTVGNVVTPVANILHGLLG